MKSFFLILLLSSLTFLLDLTDAHVRKFNQWDFNKWLDNENYIVVLFCSSMKDTECANERQKIKTLSEQMAQYHDILFGYINKDTDPLLVSQYNIQTFPMIKFFPYDSPPQNFYLNIPVPNFMEKIIEIREKHLKKREQIKEIKKPVGKIKKSTMLEIESADFESTVKNPKHHVLLIIYENESNDGYQILEKFAEVFEEENEVAFYKMRLDKTGSLRNTFSFPKDPSVYWYPKSSKDGFIYGGQLTHRMLVEYVNDQAGLSRNVNGELKANAGRIDEIDQILEKNIKRILLKNNINKIINQVQTKGKEIPHSKKYIDYYIGVLKEIRKGSNPGQVLNKEQEFLNKKVSGGGQNKKELDEWRKYYNIITAFVDFAAKSHQEDRTKINKPKKIRRHEQKTRQQSSAELKEDPNWKRAGHDEL